ncbi:MULTISPECIES: RNA-binding protein [unclassified Mesorhizobium]|uniref:RNA-binding protein n=1 Tax=unclassified Mesorhizobium TaxID=325217 RepID=UPI000FC99F13|nr:MULTISPECIES: RNA-binding protein [unclassified Mesorhizobium]RUW53790.1 RNA-binding protein [Mesorhizobium sp. M8A.F.Ca.ET.021.01.1.1]TGP95508.1 RNA-binding protein [Mesorhizobium sp. M8A.F.Ca.ET.218.01.1.1]TGT18562.1 RNA-binding protein [Mesorhizobium sp. M8A.F.Ca.ET.213.01.1.1]
MPTGLKGQKRPTDVIGNAVRVMRLATGEEGDDAQDADAKAAKILGAKGGKKRAANMTPERRAEKWC